MDEKSQLTSLTVDIVASLVEANPLRADEIPDLIRSVHHALSHIGAPVEAPPPPAVKLTAAQIRKSITPDRLISFEDGQGYMMLRRHLASRGMTPADYREKWGLPADYPMTAPSYSQKRSNLAKSLGLGRNLSAGPTKRRSKGAEKA